MRIALALETPTAVSSVRDLPIDGICQRSMEALVKRIETISAAPYR